MDSIAENWKNLSGENNWKGLLDPVDIDLRKYIIHYGEMVHATGDAFNAETKSKYCGTSRYAKKDFFSKVGLDLGNPYKYTVTKFFYATSGIVFPDAFSLDPNAWSTESTWIGYVAVATDEGKAALGRRDIVVAWRGTMRDAEWVNDFEFLLVPAPDIFGGLLPLIHHGWHSIYTSTKPESQFSKTSAREQVLSEVKRLVDLYKDEEISITVTGHSLGAAVATLNAVDIAANGYNKPTGKDKGCPVTAIVFASPKVGDLSFQQTVSGCKDLHVLRTSNLLDIVPKYPPLGYFDVGEELAIDNVRSPYLKNPEKASTAHNLEAYLHGVAGTHGIFGEFKLEIDRDISLVNKRADILKDEYFIPAQWWVEKNKSMVQQKDGSWKLMDHEDDDDFNLLLMSN